MNKQQALSLIQQVVEVYRGTLKEHQALQQALDVIRKDINAESEIEKTETKTKKA